LSALAHKRQLLLGICVAGPNLGAVYSVSSFSWKSLAPEDAVQIHRN
jgi:hypothetical protein